MQKGTKMRWLILLLLAFIFSQTALGSRPEGLIQRHRVWNLPRHSFGYIDKSGKVVIEPRFAQARPFMHGYGECFQYSPDTGEPDWTTAIFIDKSGNQLVKVTNGYDQPTSKTKAYDEIEVDGKTIVRDNYVDIWSTRGPYKFVKRHYDFCICDLSLNIIKFFPSDFGPQDVNPKTGNQWCEYKDKAFEFTGNDCKDSPMPGFEPVPMPPRYDKVYAYCDGFNEGLAAVMDKNGHWSYIDGNGNVKIKLPADCSNAQEFSEGLAAVSIGGKSWSRRAPVARISPKNGARFGYIDKTGQFVIPPKFPCPKYIDQKEVSFKGGLAKATGEINSDITYGVINRQGAFVVPPVYVSVSKFDDGLAIVDAGCVGFDKSEWNKEDKRGGRNRVEQCIKFLRQYDFIGMKKEAAELLLGPGEPLERQQNARSYLLQSSCIGGLSMGIRYANGKVDGYTFDLRDPITRWITRNVKPERYAELYDFYKENAESGVHSE
jgi:hypothetical protein